MTSEQTRALALLAGNGAALAAACNWLVNTPSLLRGDAAEAQVFAVVVPFIGVALAWGALTRGPQGSSVPYESGALACFAAFIALIVFSYLAAVEKVRADSIVTTTPPARASEPR